MLRAVGRIGPYSILAPLDQAGMAAVYRVKRPDAPGRPLVLKTIRDAFRGRDDHEKRFILEAQVASRIRHPNVVRFVDFAYDDGRPYLVLEYVEGCSLDAILRELFRRGAGCPEPIAAQIVLGVLSGLHAMHTVRDEADRPRPMLHRDLSPRNVMIRRDGRPVILDFGLTKDVEGPQLTRPGLLIGTARYMSPEHRRLEFLDPSTDIFAVGMIWFELLTARHPWPPLEPMKELLRVVFDPPSLACADGAALSMGTRDAVLKALACDRTDRFPSADAMMRAVQAAVDIDQIDDARTAAWLRTIDVDVDGRPTPAAPGGAVNGPERAATPPTDALPPLPPRRDEALPAEALRGAVDWTGRPRSRAPAWIGGALVGGLLLRWLLGSP